MDVDVSWNPMDMHCDHRIPRDVDVHIVVSGWEGSQSMKIQQYNKTTEQKNDKLDLLINETTYWAALNFYLRIRISASKKNMGSSPF